MMEKLEAPQTFLGLKAMIKEVDEDQDGQISFREVIIYIFLSVLKYPVKVDNINWHNDELIFEDNMNILFNIEVRDKKKSFKTAEPEIKPLENLNRLKIFTKIEKIILLCISFYLTSFNNQRKKT